MKGIFRIKVSKQQKSQPYILVREFFKIMVYEMAKKWRIDEGMKIFGCQNSKNSSLYNGEGEFIKIMVLKI